MAKYLVLIYGNERAWADRPPSWHEANAALHQALIAAAGPAILGVNELKATAHAVSVRADASGQPVVTEGPFHQTPEIVGGYYLLEAPDLSEAIKLASQIPEADCGPRRRRDPADRRTGVNAARFGRSTTAGTPSHRSRRIHAQDRPVHPDVPRG